MTDHIADAGKKVSDHSALIERLEVMSGMLAMGERIAFGSDAALLAEAAAALRDLTEWRDIATAPKDGTVIDAWRPEGGRDEVYWGFPHHECGEMGSLCDSDWHSIKKPGWVCNTFGEFLGGRHNPFTHWLPLPSAPNQAKEAGE